LRKRTAQNKKLPSSRLWGVKEYNKLFDFYTIFFRSPVCNATKILRNNQSVKKLDFHNCKEHKYFETLAQPLQDRLYRTALILTKSPLHAKELVQETYLRARSHYHQLELGTAFGVWLSQLLINNYMSDMGRLEIK